MSTEMRIGWGRLCQWLSRHRDALYLLLELSGLFGRAPAAPEPLEGAVEKALRPVAPSTDFRQQLRQNLSVAAARQGGVTVEDARPYRQALLLSVSAAVLAAGIATVVALTHSRWAQSQR
ncbi:MAG TPA: hypothetical protein VM366_09680 [Anaerolineae bacterium]|nr:hypothetical protein [Anaerolineae bacterium]